MIKDRYSQYIRSIKSKQNEISYPDKYPFSLEAVRQLKELELHPNVTFIIGENGSGKSTLLEAIAVAYGLNPEGGSKNFIFKTMDTHSNLSEHIRLVKGALPKDSFFLRAESFYNVSSNIDELAMAGGANLYDSYGGKSLHLQSHGESFMALAMNRFRGKGLYILDEPEAALSPSRLMALLKIIHDLVEDDSQFIIATHSPILMTYPNAIIYNIDQGYTPIEYIDTEHFKITRDFLNSPERMLKLLLSE